MGVTFGTKHSETDWGLLLTDMAIGSPEAKNRTVSIEGRDGDLDLSEALGDIRFTNREVAVKFIHPGSIDPSLISEINNALHGVKLNIIFDHDPSYYYVGRCHIESSQEDQAHGVFVVKADCAPFKFKSSFTAVNIVATTSGVVATCTVANRKVKPIITTDAPAQIIFGGDTYNITAGATTMPFYLETGANSVEGKTASGTANVEIKWKEQSL